MEPIARPIVESIKGPVLRRERRSGELAGVGAKSIQQVLDALVEEGQIAVCKVQKNKREELGYRLAKVGGPGGP